MTMTLGDVLALDVLRRSDPPAAQALGLRRQTLHGRLERIEELVGDISAPHRHLPLVVALALVVALTLDELRP